MEDHQHEFGYRVHELFDEVMQRKVWWPGVVLVLGVVLLFVLLVTQLVRVGNLSDELEAQQLLLDFTVEMKDDKIESLTIRANELETDLRVAESQVETLIVEVGQLREENSKLEEYNETLELRLAGFESTSTVQGPLEE